MSDDPTERKEQLSQADRTLLGVAPPKLETSADAGPRSPVFVRAGTAAAGEGDEPPPLPRMALPSRPPLPSPVVSSAELGGPASGAGLGGLMRAQPLVWMVALPAVVAALVIGVAVLTAPTPRPRPVAVPAPSAVHQPSGAQAAAADEKPRLDDLVALAAKPPETLQARELIQLAEGRAVRERDAARSLRERLARSPELLNEKATQAALLELARQADTSREALLALATSEGPIGPDLLYEVWTRTSDRTDSTELARALAYSADVRPRASKALSVALDLRAADTCEKNQEVLPRALTDGDKRSLHLLMKLLNKRGCGPKKLDDCFACLRAKKDELAATINAVKARRAPTFPTP